MVLNHYKHDTEFLEFEKHKKIVHYRLQSLPDDFIKWQISERLTLFDCLKNKTQPMFFQPHLPTLLTVNNDGTDFPINAACKGIGLIAIESQIPAITDKITSIVDTVQNSDFYDSIQKRIEGAMLLYDHPENIHKMALGGLEIFETKTFTNMLKNPFISLFYVGGSPGYKSYQINCIAEFFDHSDPFYRFMINMRSLFEEASFHYQQPVYPYAVKYHVLQVLDKSLQLRKMKTEKE
jgi:hypothetical protein